uniref:Basic salivary proline-rich protein 3-like n=1 Tax=Phascolarctos cinereus TaxID=38626 RepID=A0A6P5ISE3_PHACI|nr:basic salivary proline-rich protein 3-like [Phascolarctos cinereus]
MGEKYEALLGRVPRLGSAKRGDAEAALALGAGGVRLGDCSPSLVRSRGSGGGGGGAARPPWPSAPRGLHPLLGAAAIHPSLHPSVRLSRAPLPPPPRARPPGAPAQSPALTGVWYSELPPRPRSPRAPGRAAGMPRGGGGPAPRLSPPAPASGAATPRHVGGALQGAPGAPGRNPHPGSSPRRPPSSERAPRPPPPPPPPPPPRPEGRPRRAP